MLNRIDEWHSDWNFLSATKAQRYSALMLCSSALLVWAMRGWDSGIGSYGTSLHYSVFVIYGLEYAALNYCLDKKHNISGIRNLIISVLWTIFSVAVFEWYWGLGYALFYGELWILTPDNTVYTELIVITVIGVHGAALAMMQGVRPGIGKPLLFLSFMMPALLWLAQGFPQTCYPALDGTVIYIENNVVHLYNVIAKLGLAAATASVLMK